MLDAASSGALQGTGLVLNLVAILVAFVAFTSFSEGVFLWASTLLGFDDVGLLFVVGKIFIPVSWAIGVDWEDCSEIGTIIATKTIVNEFVAYQLLGEYKRAGEITVGELDSYSLLK